MSEIERRIEALELKFPGPIQLPPGVKLSFSWVRIHGDRASLSGHGPLAEDGTIAKPLGKVGCDVTLEQAQFAARLTALAMLASLRAALGDLDRIDQWLRAFGMVNAAPGFTQVPIVINGFTDLIRQPLTFGRRHGGPAVRHAGRDRSGSRSQKLSLSPVVHCLCGMQVQIKTA